MIILQPTGGCGRELVMMPKQGLTVLISSLRSDHRHRRRYSPTNGGGDGSSGGEH
ncbi:hypothetical protein Hanom_Chr01g00057061 [Helianthus anomalus]